MDLASVRQASDTLERQQRPFRGKFNKCKTLDDLEALLAKEKKAGNYPAAPWLHWIFGGPNPPKQEHPTLYWTSKPSWEGEPRIEPGKQQRLLALLRDLIENGADPSLQDTNDHLPPHALTRLIDFEELTVEQRRDLIVLAMERGADPVRRLSYPQFKSEQGPFLGCRPTSSALDRAIERSGCEGMAIFLEVILPRVDAQQLADAYYLRAIDLVNHLSGSPVEAIVAAADQAGDLNRPVTALGDLATGALVHFICKAEKHADALERLLPRLDVNRPLPGPCHFPALVRIKWGITPQITFAPGATALDILDGLIETITRAEAAQGVTKDKEFRADDARALREEASRKRELLLSRGAVNGEPLETALPAAIAPVVDELARLLRLLGHDDGPLRTAAAGIDASHSGPWGFLSDLVPPFAPQLLSSRLHDVPLLGHTLGCFVTSQQAGAEGAVFAGEQWTNELRRSELPAKERRVAKIAICFHQDGAARYLAVKTARSTEVWKLEGEVVERLAPSIAAFLHDQIDEVERGMRGA